MAQLFLPRVQLISASLCRSGLLLVPDQASVPECCRWALHCLRATPRIWTSCYLCMEWRDRALCFQSVTSQPWASFCCCGLPQSLTWACRSWAPLTQTQAFLSRECALQISFCPHEVHLDQACTCRLLTPHLLALPPPCEEQPGLAHSCLQLRLLSSACFCCCTALRVPACPRLSSDVHAQASCCLYRTCRIQGAAFLCGASAKLASLPWFAR